MLSRIAENVYWLGRYVERADDTVRLVATHYYGLLQIGTGDGGVFPAELLAVLGHPPSADPTPSLRAAVTRCVSDPDNLSSVANWNLLTTGTRGQTNFVLTNSLPQQFFRVGVLTNY